MDQPLRPLRAAFFQEPTIQVARNLLGKTLISEMGGQRVSGMIVETEAYLADDDSACHAAKYRTARTEVMFGPAGFAYVYPIHARHCFNVVTESIGQGCAVLIRAAQPLSGMAVMGERRGLTDRRRLSTGPACLCESFGIGRSVSGHNLTVEKTVWIADRMPGTPSLAPKKSVRIGVTSAKNKLLRFYIPNNPFVSGPKRMRT